MKSVEKRIAEFCIYHRDGDGECNNVVLKKWAQINCKDNQDLYELAYFFAITYCVGSAIILFRDKKQVLSQTSAWIAENKQNLVFQSDRKYIRMKDSFERCLNQFKRIGSVDAFLEKVMDKGIISLKKAIPYVSSWELFGRFSAFLFLETFVELTGIGIENTTIVWKQGNTATSGLLNVYGFDEQANTFDRTGKLLLPPETMDKMLEGLTGHIARSGGNINVTEIETSLCAYRKLYKGSRYNGFYLDRMLEEIYFIGQKHPEIAQELLEIRKQSFNEKYLGEISGWRGVRKNMKKLYLETGLIP